MDPLFEKKVKQAFLKVKEDISSIKEEFSEYKALIQNLLNSLPPYEETQKQPKTSDFNSIKENQEKNNLNSLSSIGNKGVYSFTHSFIHSPFTHLSTHSPNQNNKPSTSTLTNQHISDKIDTKHPLQTLTNKEFLVFLTIYQLEKELPKVTYIDLANRLSLTTGCIRSYISSLIRKKAPVIKSKLNNKLVILSIDTSFRSLTSEQKLINLYYQNDPYQSTLL